MLRRSAVSAAVLLAVVFATSTVVSPANATNWPTAPNGSVIAVATIVPSYQNVTARGRAVLIAPPSGDAFIAVNLTNHLAEITMAHIHVTNASAGNPVVLGLLPRPSGRLDPPLSYRGTFWFVTRFTASSLPNGLSAATFFDLLSNGLLYVNVHTTAFPGGAVRGNLTCKPPCKYT
ncbi:hypothetical protein Vretimale_15805 [Volvox reticuliferus]|uniref:CHRD domain-containing protein n=1 Tax=Volvox reticuliferus TaxID=1737510 RepID=A0A8J4LWN8_9CHLO|nr:hypothetical protein Vretifemale_18484 [Volvox reticuliferus]GIM12457.1 hypothetical protein Vretimale_15805 [Volvox reticuliferus]